MFVMMSRLVTQPQPCVIVECSYLVHPCDRKDKGGCSQICVKDGLKSKCQCKRPEFKLAANEKDCNSGRDLSLLMQIRISISISSNPLLT